MDSEDEYSPAELYGLGKYFAQLQYGDRTDNLERSIELFTRVVTDETADSPIVALACYELGISYQERPVGEKDDNLRAALDAYQSGVEALGTPADAEQRELLGNTLGNIASTYLQLDDLEAAIRACERACEFQTPETTPRSWGVTHQILGAAYVSRREGSRRANLEAAVAAFEAALQVRTPDAEPELHRRTLHALHHVQQALRAEEQPPSEYLTGLMRRAERHLSRALETGSAADLQLAMDLYSEALAVTDPPVQGALRGSALNNLAACYLQRAATKGDVDRAIDLFRQTLEVPERVADPLRWAITQYSLSAALIRWPSPPLENAELAIQAAEAALDVLNQASAEEHWAKARTNLGIALVLRYHLAPTGNRDIADLHRAVEALETGLSLGPKIGGVAPSAHTQLALAYIFLIGRAESGLRRQEYIRRFAEHYAAFRASFPEDKELHRLIDETLVLSYAKLSHQDPAEHTEEFIRLCEAYLAEADPAKDLTNLRRELAAAYLRRLGGDRQTNAARAATEYSALLNQAAPAADRTGAHADLADAQRAAGEHDRATASYRAALSAAAELSPDSLANVSSTIESHTVAAAAALLALETR